MDDPQMALTSRNGIEPLKNYLLWEFSNTYKSRYYNEPPCTDHLISTTINKWQSCLPTPSTGHTYWIILNEISDIILPINIFVYINKR